MSVRERLMEIAKLGVGTRSHVDKDPTTYEKHLKRITEFNSRPGVRESASERLRRLNTDPAFRAKKLAGHKAYYEALGGPKGYRDKEKRKAYKTNWMRGNRAQKLESC